MPQSADDLRDVRSRPAFLIVISLGALTILAGVMAVVMALR